MNLDNRQPALALLGKPGEAALRFGELLSQENWAVLGIGLNDLQPLVELYGEAWRQEALELVARVLLSGRETWGGPDDLLVHLTEETFLDIIFSFKRRSVPFPETRETHEQCFLIAGLSSDRSKFFSDPPRIIEIFLPFPKASTAATVASGVVAVVSL